MTNISGGSDYRSGKTLSYLAMGSLGGIILCLALNVILGLWQLLSPGQKIDLASGESISITYLLIGLVAIFNLLLFIGTIVFLLIWEYRQFSNLTALKAHHQELSPGWAVGWWFIPFANLVKPYQAMSELWNESDPDFDAELGFLSSHSSAPRIINWWWALFIISNIAIQISSKLSDVNPPDVGAFFPLALIISSIVRAIDAFLLIKIIQTITARQEARFQRLVSDGQFAPPLPPSFESN